MAARMKPHNRDTDLCEQNPDSPQKTNRIATASVGYLLLHQTYTATEKQ